MKAAVWNASGGLEIVERPIPEPGPGQVRIAVRSAGICGSDLHNFGKPRPFAGIIPGHEIGGVIDAAGEGVDLAPGTSVSVEGAFVCENCRYCRAGDHTHCERLQFVGFSAPGAMAEFFVAPTAAVVALPPGVPPEWGALAEPLSICTRAVRQARVTTGDRVMILGSGTIGLMSLLLARDAGAGEIFATARHPHQAEMARALGATAVFHNSQEAMSALGSSSMDVVIETVGGAAPTPAEAVHLARPLGTICVAGIFDGDSAVPMTIVALKELTLVGSFGYHRNHGHSDYAIGCESLGRHLAALQPLVTHTFPLDRVNEAFQVAADKATGSIKVHVRP